MKTIKGLNELKTIEGRVIFSKPISLVKAASVLHKFINEDAGDLDVISKYLKLASACFDEHVQFHKELKGRSRHKHKKIRMERVGSGALTDAETSHREEALPAAEQGQFVDSVEEQALKNRRKPEGGGFDDKGMNSQRKRKKDFSDFGLEARVREGGAGVRIAEEKRDKTKKRKKEEVEDGGWNDYEERHIRKNKKSKRISEDEK